VFSGCQGYVVFSGRGRLNKGVVQGFAVEKVPERGGGTCEAVLL